MRTGPFIKVLPDILCWKPLVLFYCVFIFGCDNFIWFWILIHAKSKLAKGVQERERKEKFDLKNKTRSLLKLNDSIWDCLFPRRLVLYTFSCSWNVLPQWHQQIVCKCARHTVTHSSQWLRRTCAFHPYQQRTDCRLHLPMQITRGELTREGLHSEERLQFHHVWLQLSLIKEQLALHRWTHNVTSQTS